MTAHRYCIGLISDTHGLLRPQALAALRGADFIIHAGDIGDRTILAELARIAPVTAVRGNNDRDASFADLPERDTLDAGAIRVRVIHDLAELDLHSLDRVHAVVSGHSHRPMSFERDGVLFINPGSAGPRRFRLPISVGRLRIEGKQLRAELVELSVN